MATLILQPDGAAGLDTFLHQNGPTANFGARTDFFAGVDASSATYRALIKFDISSLPASAVISSAVLSLYCTGEDSVADRTIEIYRSLVEWFEGVKNGTAPDAGQDGSTWNHRNANGSVAWGGGAGGFGSGTDRAATATTSTVITTTGTFFDFTVTADVQGFHAGTFTNHGWWIINVVGGGTTNRKHFASSDSATAAQRPKLTITYTIPTMSGTIAGTSTATGTLTTTDTLTRLQPDATNGIDTSLREFTPTHNFGLSTALASGWDSSTAKKRRGLIKFDLSSIPNGSQVVAATLRLYCSSLTGSNVEVNVHRSLVQWFEGNQTGGAPPGGEDGSTWNNKNANGATSWGAVGGQSATDYDATATVTTTVTAGSQYYTFDVTEDVQNFLDGVQTNHGWWLINTIESGGTTLLTTFASSDSATAEQRPELQVVYQASIEGTANGTATVTGSLKGIAEISGSAAGVASHNAQLISNFFSVGHSVATSTATATIRATGRLQGNSFGDSTSIADIIANFPLRGEIAGTSFHVAHLKGVFRLTGLAAGSGIAIGRVSGPGELRGEAFGTSTAVATGYARAINVALVIGCNPVPLLHITDGAVKPNGQLNILNFLSERAGYFLINYKPQIAQYKDNGYWSSSPQSQGRRLRGKVFDNVIDVIEVSARAGSQDALIQYQQDLLDFQEAASDYWTSDHNFLPFYLVARAARETNTRYALIHMISCPELENPYTQPFFDDVVGATFTSLTIRIEHGLWMSTPPGKFDCVEVSGAREWTVSGWQVVS